MKDKITRNKTKCSYSRKYAIKDGLRPSREEASGTGSKKLNNKALSNIITTVQRPLREEAGGTGSGILKEHTNTPEILYPGSSAALARGGTRNWQW